MLAMLTAIVCSILRGRAAVWLSAATAAVIVVMQLMLLSFVYSTGESYVFQMGHFPAPWGNELRAGVLEAIIASFFAFIMLLSELGGQKHIYLDVEPHKINLYFVMLNLLLGALLALVYTNDIFTAYVFIEISTLSACGLLMIREIGRTTLAAVRYMIISLIGSGFLLMGIVLLYNQTGHLLMSGIQPAVAEIFASGENLEPLLVVLALITTGLAIKAGLFPFHYWMPDTYGYSTPTASAILSGLVSKGYIFLTIKIIFRVVGFDIYGSSHIFDILFVLALLAMVFGSVSAIREKDIRRMIAFSSAAQIGYIYMGIGLGTEAGITAAIFHIICHALTKPLLFISASALSDASGGSKRFHDLRGSGFRNPVAGVAFSIGALSMVGFPLLGGFVSKLLFATASVQNSNKMLPTLIVLAISTILNAVYFMRTVINLYRIPDTDAASPQTLADGGTAVITGWRSQKFFCISSALFVAANIFIGVHSQPIIDAIEQGLKMFA